MKKYIIAISAASMLLCAALSACGQSNATLVSILFERGHGSQWGNQFYIEVNEQRIVTLRVISQSTMELREQKDIPISPEQWQELAAAVQDLELKQTRENWIHKLFGGSALDGGEYRHLTLIWQTEQGTAQTQYQWPQSQQADQLERLLEQLAKTGEQG